MTVILTDILPIVDMHDKSQSHTHINAYTNEIIFSFLWPGISDTWIIWAVKRKTLDSFCWKVSIKKLNKDCTLDYGKAFIFLWEECNDIDQITVDMEAKLFRAKQTILFVRETYPKTVFQNMKKPTHVYFQTPGLLPSWLSGLWERVFEFFTPPLSPPDQTSCPSRTCTSTQQQDQ